jgi:hypothetical protein
VHKTWATERAYAVRDVLWLAASSPKDSTRRFDDSHTESRTRDDRPKTDAIQAVFAVNPVLFRVSAVG